MRPSYRPGAPSRFKPSAARLPLSEPGALDGAGPEHSKPVNKSARPPSCGFFGDTTR